MTACERCWAEYTRRTWGLHNHGLTYADVVREREEEHGPCSPEEQCGEMHLVLDWQDGTRHCRCGKVVKEPQPDLDQLTR